MLKINNRYILIILSIITGGIFLLSGIGKMLHPDEFAMLIMAYGFPRFSFLSPIIIIVEVYLGLSMLLFLDMKRTALMSFIMIFLFTIIYLYAHFFNEIDDCGCFGAIKTLSFPSYLVILRNLILLLILYILLVSFSQDDRREFKSLKYRRIAFLILIATCIFLTGNFSKIKLIAYSNNNSNIVDNISFKGTPLASYFSPDEHKSYLALAFSYSCPHCWNSIPIFNFYKENNIVDDLIGFVSNDTTDRNEFLLFFRPNFKIIEIPKDDFKLLFPNTPYSFIIYRDSIQHANIGAIETPLYFFKKPLK